MEELGWRRRRRTRNSGAVYSGGRGDGTEAAEVAKGGKHGGKLIEC